MSTTVVSAVLSTLCGTMAVQRLTRSSHSRRAQGTILHVLPPFRTVLRVDPPQHDHILKADVEMTRNGPGIPDTIVLFKHPGTRRMAQHNWGALPITVADSADKDSVDKLSAQPAPLDRTTNLMDSWSFLPGFYV